MGNQTHAPERIRVAQDADGFWTCREAVSGSQEYVRADFVSEMLEALRCLVPLVNNDGSAEQATALNDAETAIRKARTAILKTEVRA